MAETKEELKETVIGIAKDIDDDCDMADITDRLEEAAKVAEAIYEAEG